MRCNMKKEFNLLNNKSTFIINLVFSVLEVLGGFLTNSISLISGAIHDLSDSISICISYIFEKISKKVPKAHLGPGPFWARTQKTRSQMCQMCKKEKAYVNKFYKSNNFIYCSFNSNAFNGKKRNRATSTV